MILSENDLMDMAYLGTVNLCLMDNFTEMSGYTFFSHQRRKQLGVFINA